MTRPNGPASNGDAAINKQLAEQYVREHHPLKNPKTGPFLEVLDGELRQTIVGAFENALSKTALLALDITGTFSDALDAAEKYRPEWGAIEGWQEGLRAYADALLASDPRFTAAMDRVFPGTDDHPALNAFWSLPIDLIRAIFEQFGLGEDAVRARGAVTV